MFSSLSWSHNPAFLEVRYGQVARFPSKECEQKCHVSLPGLHLKTWVCLLNLPTHWHLDKAMSMRNVKPDYADNIKVLGMQEQQDGRNLDPCVVKWSRASHCLKHSTWTVTWEGAKLVFFKAWDFWWVSLLEQPNLTLTNKKHGTKSTVLLLQTPKICGVGSAVGR